MLKCSESVSLDLYAWVKKANKPISHSLKLPQCGKFIGDKHQHDIWDTFRLCYETLIPLRAAWGFLASLMLYSLHYLPSHSLYENLSVAAVFPYIKLNRNATLSVRLAQHSLSVRDSGRYYNNLLCDALHLSFHLYTHICVNFQWINRVISYNQWD